MNMTTYSKPVADQVTPRLRAALDEESKRIDISRLQEVPGAITFVGPVAGGLAAPVGADQGDALVADFRGWLRSLDVVAIQVEDGSLQCRAGYVPGSAGPSPLLWFMKAKLLRRKSS